MGLLAESKEKDELTLVFNIRSSCIEGALFLVQKSGIPKIVFATREPIPIKEQIDVERFLSLTIQSLETVVERVHLAGWGMPARIFCVLFSPWHTSQTRIINLKKNVPFVFTAKLAEDLIQKEVKLFEEEHLHKSIEGNNTVRIIELKNIKTMLNGYETSEPLNQKAEELEITIFLSMSEEHVLKKIEDTIKQGFNFDQIKFSSFTLASFSVVRDMYIEKENFLLVYIGGEVTDISMIKKNILRESTSFPLGHSFLTRGIAASLGCTLDEATSLISLYKSGHAEETVAKKLSGATEQLRKEWIKKFQDSLVSLSSDISIPSNVFISIDKDLADFFSETIKTEQFSQYTLTESKFEIVFLGTELFHNIAIFKENAVRDPFVIINAVFLNRFLINK